jgi:nicotinamide-nucleotide amidase
VSRLKVTLIAIGSELLSGQVLDTNSAFLARELTALGFRTIRIAVIDDIQSQMVDEIRTALCDSDLVLTTGGLGPTSDDCTRHAVAEAASLELSTSEDAVARLTAHAERRGRPLNKASFRQALFPRGAEILINTVGTADAFITDILSRNSVKVPVVSLPGPPRELTHVFAEQVSPRLQTRFSIRTAATLCFRCFGLSESHVGSVVDTLTLPESVRVAYRPHFPELLITLSLNPADAEHTDGANYLEQAFSMIAAGIGPEFIFTRDANQHLADALAALLRERGLRLATAESCTGGLLAHKLVSSPGASDYFLASIVSYSNSAKEVFLGVKPSLLEAVGAVSEETARAMAYGVKNRIGADIAVSITGVAGPDGGSEEKPVGTVWIGIAMGQEVIANRYHLPFERNAMRLYASALALDLVRRKILGHPLTWETK